MDKYSDIEREAIKFAEKDPSILGLFLGSNPDDNNWMTYYFVVSTPYDGKRADAISELELDLPMGANRHFGFAEWPSDDLKKYPFLGRLVWKR